MLESKLQEIESSSHMQLPDNAAIDEDFILLYQQTIRKREIVYKILLVQIKQVQSLLLESSRDDSGDKIMQPSEVQLEGHHEVF